MSAAGEGPLFSTDLISPEVLKALPEGYNCRPLERKDYANGFLDVLRVLTTVGDITEEVSTTHILHHAEKKGNEIPHSTEHD